MSNKVATSNESFDAPANIPGLSGAINLSLAMSSIVGNALTRNANSPRSRVVQDAPQKLLTNFGASERSTVVKNGIAVPGTMMRIALLEDCQIEIEGLTRLFQENGYKVVCCSSGTDFLEMLEKESFDLLILDWNVPSLSGIEVLHNLRNIQNLTTPVLMLTSRASEYDIVQALNRGADDYLQKPWQPFEIIARVNALLRRQRYVQAVQDERYLDFVLDAKLNEITHKGQAIKLSNKEFLLAQLLLRHMGSPVSRAHIAQTVWNDLHIEARTLDVHVSRLRQKLNLTVEQGFSLASIYGYGYRLEKLAEQNADEVLVHESNKDTKSKKKITRPKLK